MNLPEAYRSAEYRAAHQLPEATPSASRLVLVFDRDQTLDDILSQQIRAYNQQLNLGMHDSEIIIAAKTYKQTFDVPAIAAYRKDHPDEFAQARESILTSPDIHLSYPPFKYAQKVVSGMLKQSALADEVVMGGYYTVRREQVAEASEKWRRSKKFPSGELVICKDPSDKIQKILDHHYFNQEKDQSNTTIILFDDGIGKLLEMAEKLAQENPAMNEALTHLHIVAFSYTTDEADQFKAKYPNAPVTVSGLPSWVLHNSK